MNLEVRGSIEEIQGLENSDLEGNLNLVEGLEHIEIETNGVRRWPGGQDIALGRELAQSSTEVCEKGRLTVFEHATHWVQHAEPGGVNRLLLEFLAGGLPGSR